MCAGFFYSSADQREKLVAAEREITNDRVRKIIELKNKVCMSFFLRSQFFLAAGLFTLVGCRVCGVCPKA